MKNLLIAILTVVSFQVYAQPISYFRYSKMYEWTKENRKETYSKAGFFTIEDWESSITGTLVWTPSKNEIFLDKKPFIQKVKKGNIYNFYLPPAYYELCATDEYGNKSCDYGNPYFPHYTQSKSAWDKIFKREHPFTKYLQSFFDDKESKGDNLTKR